MISQGEHLKLFKQIKLIPFVTNAIGTYNNYTDEHRIHVEFKDGREISVPLLPFDILNQHIRRHY